jgi:hypothetical protein
MQAGEERISVCLSEQLIWLQFICGVRPGLSCANTTTHTATATTTHTATGTSSNSTTHTRPPDTNASAETNPSSIG